MSATMPPALIDGGSPTVFVGEIGEAVRFYTKVLGMRLLYRAADHFAMVDSGNGLKIGLHPPGAQTPPPGTAGSIEIGLNVAAPIEQVVDELQKRGVRFQARDGRIVREDGSVKLAFFTDPDGNQLYLCEMMPRPA